MRFHLGIFKVNSSRDTKIASCMYARSNHVYICNYTWSGPTEKGFGIFSTLDEYEMLFSRRNEKLLECIG